MIYLYFYWSISKSCIRLSGKFFTSKKHEKSTFLISRAFYDFEQGLTVCPLQRFVYLKMGVQILIV